MPQRDLTELSWTYDLYRLGQHLVLDQDRVKARHQILRHIVSAVDASSGSLALIDAETGVFSIVAGIDLPEGVIGKVVAHGEGVFGWVRERKEPRVLAGDVSADGREEARSNRARARASAICWPLMNAEGQFIGAVSANRTVEEAPFTPADLERGKALAGLLALIIENQWLHDKQRHRIEALSRMNREILEMNQRLEEAHEQLVQAEKMASMGQLAAGIAHEINNPIGYVYSNLGTLRKYLADVFAHRADLDALKEDIEAILAESLQGVERVSRIVRDLNDFSRVDDARWQWADLHEGLDSALNIVSNEIKYKCKVAKQYGSLPKVQCLPARLNQVFVNMLMNAAQAIDKDGTITLQTRAQEEEVSISISDTGKGIPTEHLARIFEPFFTTKAPGEGTGLGLSLSYNIVRRHGGRIEVQSAPGRGATFTVHLPVRRSGDDGQDA